MQNFYKDVATLPLMAFYTRKPFCHHHLFVFKWKWQFCHRQHFTFGDYFPVITHECLYCNNCYDSTSDAVARG